MLVRSFWLKLASLTYILNPFFSSLRVCQCFYQKREISKTHINIYIPIEHNDFVMALQSHYHIYYGFTFPIRMCVKLSLQLLWFDWVIKIYIYMAEQLFNIIETIFEMIWRCLRANRCGFNASRKILFMIIIFTLEYNANRNYW